MTEPKPCPFCGGKASIIKYMDGTYCVECENDNCNMIAMTVLADTEARAVEIWNTRPSPWHTGTPTEEGLYAVLFRGDFNPNNTDCVDIYHELLSPNFEIEGYVRWVNIEGKIVFGAEEVEAWQKITPFEASKEN